MTFAEYLDKYKLDISAPNIPEIKQVKDEIAEHLYRNSANSLIDLKRPAESETVKKWRSQNKRLIHHEIFETILRESKAQLREQSLELSMASENLKTWLKEYRVDFNKNKVGLYDFYIECLLLEQLADPNAYLFVKPETEDGLNPNSDGDQTKQVSIKLDLIKSEKIRKSNDPEIFIFEGNDKVQYQFSGRTYEDFIVWVLDPYTIYQLIPIARDENNKVVYETEVWYNHNLDRLPVVMLPGELSKTKEGATYQETGFKTCIAYLNEFVNSFSDDQWMRTKSNYATLVLPSTLCSTCHGESYVKSASGTEPCKACNGTGKMKAPGISEFIILPTASAVANETTDSRKPYYLQPDLGSLEHSFNTTFELLDKAAASVGINPLIKNSESGEAMKMRMEKWNGTINYIYQKSFNFIQSILEIVDGYLYINPGDRVPPSLKIYPSITYKNPEYLKMKYMESLPIERRSAVIDYLETKYKYDHVKLKILKVLAYYYPSTILTAEELRDQIGFGIISSEDILNGNRAELLLNKLALINPNYIVQATEEDIYNKINGR